MSKIKRGLVIADGHTGHEVGLTPPEYDAPKGNERSLALYELRRYSFDWLDSKLSNREYDFTIINADCIDGDGERSGGTELIERDKNIQVDMFVCAVERWKLGHVYMSFGTPYHTGYNEQFEKQIADKLNAEKIESEGHLDINGCIINYRHHVSRSSIPHGRATPLLKAALWNDLWSLRGEYPRANILIRSHVHYHVYAGGFDQVAFTTPALQSYGTRFGSLIADGTVDYGFMELEIDEKGGFKWNAERLLFPLHKPQTLPK